jgi:hypothetical protein
MRAAARVSRRSRERWHEPLSVRTRRTVIPAAEKACARVRNAVADCLVSSGRISVQGRAGVVVDGGVQVPVAQQGLAAAPIRGRGAPAVAVAHCPAVDALAAVGDAAELLTSMWTRSPGRWCW